MIENSWDPLKEKSSEELVSATIKRQIKNILKSYTGFFDLFSEIIQNSLDAVEERKNKKEIGYEPEIFININLKENSFTVIDNGIGFDETNFKNFLAPNISFKKDNTRGNKGVGATYLAYGFNKLKIGTITPEFEFVGKLINGREWVEDEKGIISRPLITEIKDEIGNLKKIISQGTLFSIKLEGEHIRPKNLKHTRAINAEQWEKILRIKTPLGGIYFDNDKIEIKINIKVIDEEGNVTEINDNNTEYLYPHNEINSSLNIEEVQNKQKELITKGKDAYKLPQSYMNQNGIYLKWDKENILNNNKGFIGRLEETDKELIDELNPKIYAYMCYSTEVLNKYNDGILKLRKGLRIIKGGLQIATNYMPQGETITIPLTKNIGYQNVSHIVIHFDNIDPDLGRKGFQPEIIQLAEKLSVSSVNSLLKWKYLLKKETGAPPNIVIQSKKHQWIKEQEIHEEKFPLKINRKDLFLPMKEPSITSEPLNEQDVVSLFNQLLAGGVIRGIKLLSASQHNTYDGVLKFIIKNPFDLHLYNKDTNPLGILDIDSEEEILTSPLILEYKYNFNALIEDFEKEEKFEDQIDLVVVWEMGKEWEKKYEVTSLLNLNNIQHRAFHGLTHLVKNPHGNKTLYTICIKELIEYINNPEEYQLEKANIYEED